MTERFGGIDVGERQLDCAVVDGGGRIQARATLPARDPEALVAWFEGASVVAIDAPEAPSTAPHSDSDVLAPKFRTARCAEIELGRSHGSWVSWVAPSSPPFPGWMEAGFGAFGALGSLGHTEVLEVYPYAVFRDLAGGRRLHRKTSAAGRRERSAILARAGLKGDALAPLEPACSAPPPSHDVLDALAAALVALDRFRGRARCVTCGHDGSAIWLPGQPR